MSVRGYAEWKPKGEAAHWTNAVNHVVEDLRQEWPLTVRQLFYRVVAVYDYEKTEAAYGKLTGYISRARRAGYIPWEAVRDGGQGKSIGAQFFTDGEHFEASVLDWAAKMKLDRQRGQDSVLELWCEAGGMVPILQRVAAPYSARVNSGGGYDSVTSKHRLAVRVADRAEAGLKTLILHVGDFDGSGEDMCDVLRDDAGTMAITQVLRSAARDARLALEDEDHETWAPDWVLGRLEDPSEDVPDRAWQRVINWALDFFTVERIALTGEQVVERQVITAPPKKSDSRTAEFTRRNQWVADELGTDQITAQLEALTPQELRDLIQENIEAHLDMDVYAEVLAEEEDVREDLLARLNRE